MGALITVLSWVVLGLVFSFVVYRYLHRPPVTEQDAIIEDVDDEYEEESYDQDDENYEQSHYQ